MLLTNLPEHDQDAVFNRELVLLRAQAALQALDATSGDGTTAVALHATRLSKCRCTSERFQPHGLRVEGVGNFGLHACASLRAYVTE